MSNGSIEPDCNVLGVENSIHHNFDIENEICLLNILSKLLHVICPQFKSAHRASTGNMSNAVTSAPAAGQYAHESAEGDRQDVDIGGAGRFQQQADPGADDAGRLRRIEGPGS